MAINYDKYLYSTGIHYISNSGKDENSGTKGGKAGDQTGHEWELRSWYSRPWTVVLRYPDQAVALKIAELGIAAALNNNIGYDQAQRATYWKQLQAVGYDPSKIEANHKCEEDCTAGVTANVRACGYIFGIPALQGLDTSGTRSSNMRSRFVKAGFKTLTDKKYITSGKYLLPGDILLYENHHAATNITLGSKVKPEWHPGIAPAPSPVKLGDRDLRKGDTGEDVRELQNDLMTLGWSFPKYGADGDFGSETEANVKGFQRVNNLDVTGVFDHKSYVALMAALEKAKKYVQIDEGKKCFIRTGPGTEYEEIGVAHSGDKLPYQGVTFENGWHLVMYDNRNACVSGKYSKLVD